METIKETYTRTPLRSGSVPSLKGQEMSDETRRMLENRLELEEAEGSFSEIYAMFDKDRNARGDFRYRARIATISPEEAERIIKHKHQNRALRQGNYLFILGQMKQNKFVFNGESIVFSQKGELLDGHHRMKSVMNSGKTRVFTVVFGIEDWKFYSFDSGVSRNRGDVGSIVHFRNPKATMACADRLAKWVKGELETRTVKMSPGDLKNIVLAHPGIQDSAVFGSALDRFSCGEAQLLHFLASEVLDAPTEVEGFLNRIRFGNNLDSNDPAHVLREIMYGHGKRMGDVRGKYTNEYGTHPVKLPVLRLFFGAWNLYYSGKFKSLSKKKVEKYIVDYIRSLPLEGDENYDEAVRNRWALETADGTKIYPSMLSEDWLFGE